MGETNILIKLHWFILGNYFLELLQRTKFGETMKSMVFHHLYKTLTFARIKGREKDLETKYWNKIQSILFTEKSNIILVWYKTKNEWCFSSPNNSEQQSSIYVKRTFLLDDRKNPGWCSSFCNISSLLPLDVTFRSSVFPNSLKVLPASNKYNPGWIILVKH